MEKKQLLRHNAQIIRNSLDVAKISNDIVTRILQWEIFKKSKNVMIFYPIKSEISLLKLLENNKKNFLFPTIENNNLVPIQFKNNEQFSIGKFNIPEPVGKKLEHLEQIDLIFLPALSADTFGNRLGYGKGYYDRFISKFDTKTIKVIALPEILFVEKLPTEPHDKSADYIITEEKILKSKSTSPDD